MADDMREGYWGKPLRPTKVPKDRRQLWLPPYAIIFFVIIIVLALIFVHSSLRSQNRLAIDPPAEFSAAPADWSAQRKVAEQKLARAYWDLAVNIVQWRYTYANALPASPPPEFQLKAASSLSSATVPDGSRDFYWQRLRQVWPYAWRQSYVWDTRWVSKLTGGLQGKFFGNE